MPTHAFHLVDSKDPDIHVLDNERQQQLYTQQAPSTKMECDYLYGHIHKKISPKMVNPRDIAGNTEEEEVVTNLTLKGPSSLVVNLNFTRKKKNPAFSS